MASHQPIEPRYDAALVFERLIEAADTLRRIKVPDIQRNVTRWPDVVHAALDATIHNRSGLRRGPASPEAITRMDEALAWLKWLGKDVQRMVWSRVEGLSWRRIAALAGVAPNTCRARARASLVEIAERLNRHERP
jgi:DNA-directed RNA polymerase specialized sigma24 family protein